MKIAFCIFTSIRSKSGLVEDYMVELTHYYAYRMKFALPRDTRQPDIVFADSIDNGLKKYANLYDHILFMAAGCRITEDNVITDIMKEIDNNPDYLCAAHILDWTNKDRWYELHHQFVMINIGVWNDIGCPKFGGWTDRKKELPVIERSIENFHDDYTPLWIKDSGERRVQRYSHPGWNFIDQGLRWGCDIINWNELIRSKRTFYYPETDTELFWDCIKQKKTHPGITNFNQKKFLEFITHGVQDQIWLYNSEDMAIDHGNAKYDIVALPASGFKYLDVFKSNILNEGGKLIVYDFNPKALQWIKIIHQSRELPEDIEILASKFEHRMHFKQVRGHGFLKALNYFEDLNKFKTHLNSFRKMDVTFIECDLVKQPEPLLDLIKNDKSLLHISNIFSTDWLIAAYGLKYAKQRLRYLLNLIPRSAHGVRLSGQSPLMFASIPAFLRSY